MSDLFDTNYEDGEEYEGEDVPYFEDDDDDDDIEFDEGDE